MSPKLTIHHDERGELMEVFRFPEFGQVHYSVSKPNAVRGGHYHTRKREYFCVVEGEGKISMRDRVTGERKEYLVSGRAPEVVEMPLNWVHNIRNVGTTEMKLLVWANEVYDPNDPDTFKEEV